MATRGPPLVEESGGFLHTGRVVPDGAEQQQVAPQNSLRHRSGVSPLLAIDQAAEQIHDVALENTHGMCRKQKSNGGLVHGWPVLTFIRFSRADMSRFSISLYRGTSSWKPWVTAMVSVSLDRYRDSSRAVSSLTFPTLQHNTGVKDGVFRGNFPVAGRSAASSDGPDQLEDVVDEAGPVVAGQHRVVVLQQVDDGVPAVALVVDHVVATHVHVELHPVHLLREVEDVCTEADGQRRVSLLDFLR